ncbi:MAG TPA: A/G-specific adenine glycosylase [Chthoniobacterales bacterium]
MLRWYAKHGRDLPWRRTRDPYAILVSELMLQQTTVATVVPRYQEWLRRFPDFPTLAAASERQVLHAWQGLGYYSRARHVHAAARQICRDHAGRCPETLEKLRALPGVGHYTAQAVLAFAFDRPVGIVETNIARLLARLSNMTQPIDAAPGRRLMWAQASQLVPLRGAAIFNSALMDLGATVCLPRTPKCGICPVRKFCRATNPADLPVKRPRPKKTRLSEHHALTIKRDQILLQQCRQRWRGMWMLPPLSSARTRAPLHTRKFPFTHHEVTLRVFAARAPSVRSGEQRWFHLRRLESIPIPSPHRRAIEALVDSSELSVGR